MACRTHTHTLLHFCTVQNGTITGNRDNNYSTWDANWWSQAFNQPGERPTIRYKIKLCDSFGMRQTCDIEQSNHWLNTIFVFYARCAYVYCSSACVCVFVSLKYAQPVHLETCVFGSYSDSLSSECKIKLSVLRSVYPAGDNVQRWARCVRRRKSTKIKAERARSWICQACVPCDFACISHEYSGRTSAQTLASVVNVG